jgi:membrane protein DedA with SNARE-associated domain
MTAAIILTVFSAVLSAVLIIWVMFWVGFYTGQRFERGERSNNFRRSNVIC